MPRKIIEGPQKLPSTPKTPAASHNTPVKTDKAKGQPPKAGRPISLTQDKANRIIEALQAGAPLRVAAAAGGISQDALAGYRDPKSPTYIAEFAERVTCARDVGASELVESVRAAAKTDWRAARFLLGVMLPDTYGNRVMVSGAPGASPIHIEGDLRIAGDIRANVKATGKLHEAILDAAKTKR